MASITKASKLGGLRAAELAHERRDCSVVSHAALVHLLRFRIMGGTFTAYVSDFRSCMYMFFFLLVMGLILHWSDLYYMLLSPFLSSKINK